MYGRVEWVTPDMAQDYLTHSKGNRAISRYRVDMYADMMKQGKWQLTGQGISFDEAGVLKDGHHRLNAIIQAGVPVFMWVCRDVPKESTEYDTGYGRNMTAQMRFNHGIDADLANPTITATVKLHYDFLYGYEKNVPVSPLKAAQFIQENADDLRIVSQVCNQVANSRVIMKRASYVYSFFCAYKCGISLAEIADFGNVVASGFYQTDKQTAAIVVRNATLEGFDRARKGGDTTARKREAAVIQTGLRDYINGLPRKRRYMPDKCIALYTEQYLKGVDA